MSKVSTKSRIRRNRILRALLEQGELSLKDLARITLVNPEVIVLGGRVSGAGNFILNPVRTTAMQHALVQLSRDVEFLISPLGAKAGSLGVAMLAARDLFEVEHLNPSAFV
jgi:hypothetical protein